MEKQEQIEHLDLLPEPKAFINDYEQLRIQSFAEMKNTQRRLDYEQRKIGTRLDRS